MSSGAGDWIEDFLELLGGYVPPTARTPYDWLAIEAQLGFALPTDYRSFIDRVGAGCFEDEVCVLPPIAERGRSIVGNIGRELSYGESDTWLQRCFFLVDGNGNEAAWVRNAQLCDDANDWPVELFVHEEERDPYAWGKNFRSLMLSIASPEGVHHPGFEADDQVLQGRPRSYRAL